MKGDTFFEKLRDHSPAYVSAFCAFMMLCFVPIVYRNAFFDINRIKVYSVYAIIPLTLVLMLFAVLFRKNNRKTNLQDRSILICFGAMAVFLVSCLLSCLFSGFSAAVLLGNQGRYCGFLFLICCGAAFYLIACPGISGKHILPAIELTVGLVALLGVLNAMGIDPLGFYDRIKRGQEQMFMSTIGHFDFFGTYMVMLFPLCAGTFLFSGKRICRWFGFVCCVLSLMGAAAARTDSALLGIQMGCAALVALSGGSFFRLFKALIVWAIAFFSLPVVGFLMKNGAFGLTYSGPHKLLCEQGIAYFAGAVLFSAASVSSVCTSAALSAAYSSACSLFSVSFSCPASWDASCVTTGCGTLASAPVGVSMVTVRHPASNLLTYFFFICISFSCTFFYCIFFFHCYCFIIYESN